jgi:hypothetical protein
MLRRFYENKTENDKFHVTGSGEHDKGVKAWTAAFHSNKNFLNIEIYLDLSKDARYLTVHFIGSLNYRVPGKNVEKWLKLLR